MITQTENQRRPSGDLVVNAGEGPLRPRKVKFDWSDMPAHWLADDVQTMHTMNVLHLVLPKMEAWIIDVLHAALPLLQDSESKSALRGLLGQESIHSRTHAEVLSYLEQGLGVDATQFTRVLDLLFDQALADKPFGVSLPGPLRRPWFLYRVAICAAIEHYTAFLGAWALETEKLDQMGMDPRMVDLFRWHGAEEVEHRGVIFDVGTRLGTHWLYRSTSLAGVTVWFLGLLLFGTRFLMANDVAVKRGATWREFFSAQRRGVLPQLKQLLKRIPVYLQPNYHPREMGSIPMALAYLERSPGVLAAS